MWKVPLISILFCLRPTAEPTKECYAKIAACNEHAQTISSSLVQEAASAMYQTLHQKITGVNTALEAQMSEYRHTSVNTSVLG